MGKSAGMSLCDLLEKDDYILLNGDERINVHAICYDTRDMSAESVYVCIKGEHYNGHDLIREAIYKGAVAVVVEENIQKSYGEITIIKVNSTRHALAKMSAKFFDYPACDMIMIGITGTKGKTTTGYMIKSLLEASGICVGIIGSIEIAYKDVSIHNDNTTPESYILHKTLAHMRSLGIEAVVMEVSSQALKLGRVEGIEFDYGVYTNLSKDHIGPTEHKDMDEYMKCKAKLFGQCRCAVINQDDSYSEYMIEEANRSDVLAKIICYGTEVVNKFETEVVNKFETEYVFAENVCATENMPGMKYKLKNNQSATLDKKLNCDITIRLPGIFSVYNSLAAVAVWDDIMSDKKMELSNDRYRVMANVLESFSVQGRTELMESVFGYRVMVDYAHNEMSLKSVLVTMRQYTEKKLICIFGCGGNRSKERRYKMGEVSAEYADVTVITDDNPRYEASMDIISDIETGILRVLDKSDCISFMDELSCGKYIIRSDRQKAIQNTLSKAEKGDMIIIAGKGHENYQEILGIRYPLNDMEIVKEIIRLEKSEYYR